MVTSTALDRSTICNTEAHGQRVSTDTNPVAHTNDTALLDALQHSAHRLSKCSLDGELLAGVRELQCYIQNIRWVLRDYHSVEDELFASWPIRNWLRIVPRGHMRLAENDPLFLMYLANYETTMLAVCTRLPYLGQGLSVGDRTNAVSRMREAVDNMAPDCNEKIVGREREMRMQARQSLYRLWELLP